MGGYFSSPVEKEPNALRLGILSVARISPDAIIDPAKRISSVKVVAVASRSLSKAQEFAKKYSIPNAYGSYEEIINDPNIDAIYIPLPNSMHCEWSIKALRSGKHVLCEKPLASNEEEAKLMKIEAEKCKLSLVEAFHYKYYPAMIRLKEIIANGEIGRIKHVSVQFCMASYISPLLSIMSANDIRFQYNLAGGITMDAGCYTVNVIRNITGKEPQVTAARADLMYPQVDSSMEADFKFDDGTTASMRASFRNPGLTPFSFFTEVIGENGKIFLNNFLVPHHYHYMTIESNGKKRTEKHYGDTTYYYQLKAFIQEVRNGVKCPTDAADAVKNMKVIDQIYEKAGLMKRGMKLDVKD